MGFIGVVCEEEGFEDGLRALEVVMDHVHEEGGVDEVGDELPRRSVRLIETSPLAAELERLVLYN